MTVMNALCTLADLSHLQLLDELLLGKMIATVPDRACRDLLTTEASAISLSAYIRRAPTASIDRVHHSVVISIIDLIVPLSPEFKGFEPFCIR